MWLTLWWGTACELQDLVSDERDTVVDDVRVIAAIAEPPEIENDEPLRVVPHVANPRGVRLDLMIWTCIPQNEVCFEFLDGFWPFVALDWDPAELPIEVQRPRIDEQVLLLAGEIRLPFYVLACEADVCPIIADIQSGSADVDTVVRLLGDPATLMATLPLEGVHLAGRSVVIGDGIGEPNSNPTLMERGIDRDGCAFPSQLAAGATRQICLGSADSQGGPLAAYPFVTAGRVTPGMGRVRELQVDFEYTAPSAIPELNPVRLWVVAEVGDGAGSAIFTRQIRILEP